MDIITLIYLCDKVVIVIKKFRNFLTDENGMDQRDFLLVISVGVFFLFVSIGLIMILLDRPLDTMYLDLLGTVSPVVIGITTGIFGVQITQEFRKKNDKNRYVEEEIPYEEVYYNEHQNDENYYNSQQDNNKPTI